MASHTFRSVNNELMLSPSMRPMGSMDGERRWLPSPCWPVAMWMEGGHVAMWMKLAMSPCGCMVDEPHPTTVPVIPPLLRILAPLLSPVTTSHVIPTASPLFPPHAPVWLLPRLSLANLHLLPCDLGPYIATRLCRHCFATPLASYGRRLSSSQPKKNKKCMYN